MGQLLMKLNSVLGDYVCKNWVKVQFDYEYGYFARFTRKLGIFVDLDYNVYLIGLRGKIPPARLANKIFVKLIEKEWITPIDEDYYAPFGIEFENRLPFEIDDTVVELKGELDNGN